MTTSMVPCKTR